MDQHDAPDNVYALFPGIDTKPFGARASEAAEVLGGAGWSAAPERTVTDSTPVLARAKQWLPHPLTRTARVRIVGWLALAVIAGAAMSIARGALAPTRRPSTVQRQTAGGGRQSATRALSITAALQATAAELADFERSRNHAVSQSRRAHAARLGRHRTRARQRSTTGQSPRVRNARKSVTARQYQPSDVQPQTSNSSVPATNSAAPTGESANAPAAPTATDTAGSHPSGSTASNPLGGIGSCVKGC